MKMMKKISRCLLIACLLLCMGVNAALAYSYSLPVADERDFETSTLSDGSVEITAYTGSMTEFAIPQIICGCEVAAIGKE